MLSPQLTGVADNASLPFASTLCGACYDACPVAIDIPSMLVHLRSRAAEAKREAHRLPAPERALMASAAWTMADPGRWARALRAARLGRLLGGRRRRISALPPPLNAWTSTRDLPLPHRETFREWWSRRRGAQEAGGSAADDRDGGDGRVAGGQDGEGARDAGGQDGGGGR